MASLNGTPVDGGEEGVSSGQSSLEEMGDQEQARVEAVQQTTVKS